MNNSSHVMLVTQTRVKPDKNQDFVQWQETVSQAVTKFPGYISETITRPNPPIQLDWVIVQYFISADAARRWLQSNERRALLTKALPLFVGVDNVYLVEEKTPHHGVVSATISTIILPEAEQKFLDWNARIAPIQSTFPGFLGCKLERPRPGINDDWLTIVTFDSDEHLESWLNSDERKKLINELNSFSSESHVRKVYSGFDFWFNQGKDSQRSAWKENMLVLLTLYPVVFLLSYIQNPLMAHGMPFWLALFFGNAASTAILGWITVPWLMKLFWWWINPPVEELTKRYTFLGTGIVLLLYAISLCICWLLSTYR